MFEGVVLPIARCLIYSAKKFYGGMFEKELVEFIGLFGVEGRRVH